MKSLGVTEGDFVRITTKRGRSIVGRVASDSTETAGEVLQIDRFARQALKAFPHEQVTIEPVSLTPARQVILTPAIEIPVGHQEELTYQGKHGLAEQEAPVREGMLLYVKLADGLAGITYDVHSAS